MVLPPAPNCLEMVMTAMPSSIWKSPQGLGKK
jgi:hypothetical protein